MRKAAIQVRETQKTSEYLTATVIVALCTVVALQLRPHVAAANLVMIYLAGVVVVAARFHRHVAVFTSVLSVAAFDFFCVPPYLTYRVSDYEYLITLSVMLGVALFISAMTVRLRRLASGAMVRESQTNALYRLSTSLAGSTRLFDIMKIAAQLAGETFQCRAAVFLPDQTGKISMNKRTSDLLIVPSSEQTVAQWVFENRERAGINSETFRNASAIYLPIKGERQVFGVMALVPDAADGTVFSEEQHLLGVFMGQIALAVERAVAASTAQAAEVRVEAENLRTSLLSAVSHDLRTPLASITGAAATLGSHWERMDVGTRSELIATVTDESDRLNRLLSNLLEVTKLEAGVQLQKERFPIEEIIGAALHRLRAQLADRPVKTEIPPNLPLVPMDAVLMEQVFVNLLENALKYTPAGTPIEVTANSNEKSVDVEVRDRGRGFTPGWEDRIFDKFFRGRVDNVRGAGLGLAICRAIIEAHGGSIAAENRTGGGAIIRFHIPLR